MCDVALIPVRFALARRFVSEGGVDPLSVVEQLDVVKQRAECFGPGFWNTIAEVVEAFSLDRGPEGFAQSIVVAVTFAAHALKDLLLFQQQSKAFAGVLTPRSE